MSASLVGSEMCIRDRLCDPPRGCGSPGTLVLPGALGLRPPRVWSWGSVSYTHLTLPTICSV
eukprot:826535-Alexandrium_andersonii.AAC.1